jgi:hypothetical protein
MTPLPEATVTALPAEVRAAIVRAVEALEDGDVGYALEILAALEDEYTVPVENYQVVEADHLRMAA